MKFETRTYYFPANLIGRYIFNYLVARIGCSIGDVRKVAGQLAVPVTVPKADLTKVERILQMYGLM